MSLNGLNLSPLRGDTAKIRILPPEDFPLFWPPTHFIKQSGSPECPLCVVRPENEANNVVTLKVLKARPGVHEVPMVAPRHRFRNWMRGRCYHERIQKKWNKKVAGKTVKAVKWDPATLTMPESLFQRISDLAK